MNTLRKGLDAFLRWFCIILFAALVALIAFQVGVRYLGGGGHAWTEALARIVFIWQGIVGAAYVIGENDDVAIDFLVRKFPPFVVKFFEVAAHSIVAFFAVWVMIWGGWLLSDSAFGQTVELLPFPLGALYMILPVSGALIAIYCIMHIVTAVVTPVKELVAEEDVDLSTIMEEGI